MARAELFSNAACRDDHRALDSNVPEVVYRCTYARKIVGVRCASCPTSALPKSNGTRRNLFLFSRFFRNQSRGGRGRWGHESGDSVPNAEVFALVSSRPVRPCFSIFFFFLPFPTRYKRESLSCERTSNTNTANRCFACCAAYRTIGAITFRIYVIIVFV